LGEWLGLWRLAVCGGGFCVGSVWGTPGGCGGGELVGAVLRLRGGGWWGCGCCGGD